MGVQEYRARLDELYRETKKDLVRAEKRTLKAVHISREDWEEIACLKGRMGAYLRAIEECFALAEVQSFKGFEK